MRPSYLIDWRAPLVPIEVIMWQRQRPRTHARADIMSCIGLFSREPNTTYWEKSQLRIPIIAEWWSLMPCSVCCLHCVHSTRVCSQKGSDTYVLAISFDHSKYHVIVQNPHQAHTLVLHWCAIYRICYVDNCKCK